LRKHGIGEMGRKKHLNHWDEKNISATPCCETQRILNHPEGTVGKGGKGVFNTEGGDLENSGGQQNRRVYEWKIFETGRDMGCGKLYAPAQQGRFAARRLGIFWRARPRAELKAKNFTIIPRVEVKKIWSRRETEEGTSGVLVSIH